MTADSSGTIEGSRFGGVAGNARLTGSVGAAIFVALAAEGVTVLKVSDLISWHVFIGMLLVPIVAVKTASTGYRFVRYYVGQPDYVRKGAPPFALRVLGPLVVATTLLVLATGIGALAVGPSSRWMLQLHKASFIVWFAAMTIHVLGHIVETPALAFADWRRNQQPVVAAAGIRIAVLVAACASGVLLGALSLGWISAWQHVRG